jgi:hypothetical protein
MLPSDCLASFSANDIKYLRSARKLAARPLHRNRQLRLDFPERLAYS